MTEPIHTLPIAGWELKTVPEYNALLISFAYLSNMLQTNAEAVTDRTYILHTAQARELAQKILALLAKMENAGPQENEEPRH